MERLFHTLDSDCATKLHCKVWSQFARRQLLTGQPSMLHICTSSVKFWKCISLCNIVTVGCKDIIWSCILGRCGDLNRTKVPSWAEVRKTKFLEYIGVLPLSSPEFEMIKKALNLLKSGKSLKLLPNFEFHVRLSEYLGHHLWILHEMRTMMRGIECWI